MTRRSGPSGKHTNLILRISGVTPEQRDAWYAHAETRGGFAAWARDVLDAAQNDESPSRRSERGVKSLDDSHRA